jgi:hypothetical protein
MKKQRCFLLMCSLAAMRPAVALKPGSKTIAALFALLSAVSTGNAR